MRTHWSAIATALVFFIGFHSTKSNAFDIESIITTHIKAVQPDDGIGGIAVAVRFKDSTLLYNFGNADAKTGRLVTSDTLFNLGSVGKVFDATIIGQSAIRGEIKLDDSVASHIPELADGADVRKITYGQLASYTSGFVLPQDGPPWLGETFTRASFLDKVRNWKADAEHRPGGQLYYSHAGYILLHIALEGRFGAPFNRLMAERILEPLGLTSTALPEVAQDAERFPRGQLPTAFRRLAVQGYDEAGIPIGEPGDLQGFYHFLGAGQMYSTARDMGIFLACNLGLLPNHVFLTAGMGLAQQPIFPMDGGVMQAMAWEVHPGESVIVDKYGGLNNASAYLGMLPSRKMGVVILSNRGSLNIAETGRSILRALATSVDVRH